MDRSVPARGGKVARVTRVRLFVLVLACLAGLGALGALAAATRRSAQRQHGTPDHWPAVARKPAAA